MTAKEVRPRLSNNIVKQALKETYAVLGKWRVLGWTIDEVLNLESQVRKAILIID